MDSVHQVFLPPEHLCTTLVFIRLAPSIFNFVDKLYCFLHQCLRMKHIARVWLRQQDQATANLACYTVPVLKYLQFGSVTVRSRFALGTLESVVRCGSVRFIAVRSAYFWSYMHALSATRLAFVHAAATFYYTVERSSCA